SDSLALEIYLVLHSRLPPTAPPRSPYPTLFRSSRRREASSPPSASARRSLLTASYCWRAPNWQTATARVPAARSFPSGERQNSIDRKSTRLNSSHVKISYAVFCLKKKKKKNKHC